MSKQHRNNLFTACNLNIILKNNCSSVIHQVESIPENEFISTPPEVIITNVLSKNSIHPLIVHKDNIKMHKPLRCKIDQYGKPFPLNTTDNPGLRDGINVLIEIPYSGDKRLWLCQPSLHDIREGPNFTIKNDHIEKNFTQPENTPYEHIIKRFKENYKRIHNYLKWQAKDIKLYEAKLQKVAAKAIHDRRIKLQKNHIKPQTELSGLQLEIRRKDRPHAPPAHEIDITRQHFISSQDFDNILEIIRDTGHIFEKTPGIFNIHTAEELRNILVSNLNTHFASKANEELFHNQGKTHFQIKKMNKEVFLGKCSTWNCPEGAIYTINNLLSNSGWNKCKISFVIFNIKFRRFMDVLFQMESSLLDHPCLIELNEAIRKNEWSLRMTGLGNTDLRFDLQVMIFNLYKKKKKINPLLTEPERNFFTKIY